MSCTPLQFSPKRTDEIITLGMDFVNVLASGEVIQTSIWTVDPVNPRTVSSAGMVLGISSIFGTKVTQQIQSGINNSQYDIVATVTTNFGNRLQENALLLVTNDAFK